MTIDIYLFEWMGILSMTLCFFMPESAIHNGGPQRYNWAFVYSTESLDKGK